MDQKVAEMLNSLVQLEEDAVRACDQASIACHVTDIRTKVREFREQHARRSRHLAQSLLAVGQHVVRRDERGFLMEGFSPRMGGVDEVLAGLRQDEELVARSYGAVRAHELPDDVRVAVEQAAEEEKQTLEWIESALTTRAWESAA